MADTMNSLLSDTVRDVLTRWDAFRHAATSLAAAPAVRADIAGLQGAATSFFVSAFADANRNNCISALQYTTTGRYPQGQNAVKSSARALDCMIVVPNGQTANDVMTDLATALGDRAELFQLPWWGQLPYRSAAVGSAVFGMRSGVLAMLSLQRQSLTRQTKPRLFVVTQRALQSPVPDPAYVRSLVFSLYKGAEIDPTDLAEKLTAIGYTRVPKTSVPGEFTLRGEVLDIFTPGAPLPARIVFDFDAVGQIK
ncbi:MAG: transcription-repair coupling factor, partial [Treponemataceae bacterium]|nr:transcription-repair coupling factor [Treponemataceae bacterium]